MIEIHWLLLIVIVILCVWMGFKMGRELCRFDIFDQENKIADLEEEVAEWKHRFHELTHKEI